MGSPRSFALTVFVALSLSYGDLPLSVQSLSLYPPRICIVGAGMSGSAAAHFLRNYSDHELDIQIFDKSPLPGGRMAMVDLNGDFFEAGASILHPKNYYASRFTELLGLKKRTVGDKDGNFGIWDGSTFILQTKKPGASFISERLTGLFNSIMILWRYKSSLLLMNNYVTATLQKFLQYYNEPRPIFSSVEEMLRWAGLFEMTQSTSENELSSYGLSKQLIDELVTVIMRINYGQNVSISGLAGAVSLCGSGEEFWAVEGGNWQMAAGLVHHSNASIFLNVLVRSISAIDGGYEVSFSEGDTKFCNAVILATSLDESNIKFAPTIALPERHMQHTFTTFVRGIINPSYFGMTSVESIPDMIGTLEVPMVPFSSVNVLKSYSAHDKAYKLFSRAFMTEELLDQLFSVRSNTVRLDWAAYPHYEAPEKFAPFILDNKHLYYINAFESAASTMETGAVAADNVARLLLSRLLEGGLLKKTGNLPVDRQEQDL